MVAKERAKVARGLAIHHSRIRLPALCLNINIMERLFIEYRVKERFTGSTIASEFEDEYSAMTWIMDQEENIDIEYVIEMVITKKYDY